MLTQAPYSWNKYEANSTLIYKWARHNAYRENYYSDEYEYQRDAESGMIEYILFDTKPSIVNYGSALYPDFEYYRPNRIRKIFEYYGNRGWLDGSSQGISTIVGKYCALGSGDIAIGHITRVIKTFSSRITLGCTRYNITNNTAGVIVGYVTSTSSGTYPNNGISANDGYWYTSTGSETQYSQGNFVGVVRSDDPDTYPTNGIHTDGYWYVRL